MFTLHHEVHELPATNYGRGRGGPQVNRWASESPAMSDRAGRLDSIAGGGPPVWQKDTPNCGSLRSRTCLSDETGRSAE